MLGALGLSAAEDVVYRYLLTTRSATATDVESATGLSAAVAAQALAGLAAAGFAHRVTGDQSRFAAAPPRLVDAAISARLAELREAQATLGQVAARYHATRLEAEGVGIFEVIRGPEALRERTREMVAAARSEALNMVKPPLVALQIAEHVEPGAEVRGRVVFDRAFVSHAGVLDAIIASPDSHYEVRVHTLVPAKMLAIDRTMALLPVRQHDDTPVAVLITESAVLDSFLALFDYVWETATTLHSAASEEHARDPGRSPLAPDDRRLLSLLLAGLTDQAIAGHLRVSVRTVERRVRALMDAVRVRTRTQLAWEAARRNWLLSPGTTPPGS